MTIDIDTRVTVRQWLDYAGTEYTDDPEDEADTGSPYVPPHVLASRVLSQGAHHVTEYRDDGVVTTPSEGYYLEIAEGLVVAVSSGSDCSDTIEVVEGSTVDELVAMGPDLDLGVGPVCTLVYSRTYADGRVEEEEIEGGDRTPQEEPPEFDPGEEEEDYA